MRFLRRDVFELGLQHARDHLVGALLIVEQVADALLVGAQERIDLRDALDVDAGGSRPASARRGGCVLRTASSAAIQPPSEWPTRSTSSRSSCVEKIEIEVGEVGDVIEPVRRVGCAEARMLRRDHVEVLRQLRMKATSAHRLRHADTGAARPRRRASGGCGSPRQ